MRLALRLVAVFIAAQMSASVALAQASDEQVVHQRMMASGFIPLDEMTFGGRDVRRVLPVDPYGMLPIPGVELERHADGRLTLRAQYRGWTGQAYDVSTEEWEQVSSLQAAAYAPSAKRSILPKSNVIVHCWSGYLEASPNKTASWSECNDGTRRSKVYGSRAHARHAEDGLRAERDGDAMAFLGVSEQGAQFDDPALAVTVAELRARWAKQREPGSDILAQARAALKVARTTRTQALIAAAQDAVFAFGRHQEALRTIVQTGLFSFGEAEKRGGASAVILNDTRRAWLADINAQNENYTGLLEELARLQSGREVQR